jgi:hypothetical protein
MTESHNSMKTGIPNRQKTASNPLLLAESITSGASLGRLAQRLGGSSRATLELEFRAQTILTDGLRQLADCGC